MTDNVTANATATATSTLAGNTYTLPTTTWHWAQQGWECPRCHKIHAPFVSGCTCGPTMSSVGPVWVTPTMPITSGTFSTLDNCVPLNDCAG